MHITVTSIVVEHLRYMCCFGPVSIRPWFVYAFRLRKIDRDS